MARVIVFLLAVLVAAAGLSWLADQPGTVVISLPSREITFSVYVAVVGVAMLVGAGILLWSLIVTLWRSPGRIGSLVTRRRQMRGLEALSGGMIAIGSGDRTAATRYAVQARKSLPHEPLTHLLRAQAAQLSGDRVTARRIFEAMIGSPETEQLGLRGLFLEAEQEGEQEAARQFAERSIKLNPKLAWPVDALFDIQCKAGDWEGALATVGIARRNQHLDSKLADRRRAVLLTARAQAIEESDPLRATQLALEAHHLAVDLVPAAAIAGRLLAARGNTQRAARVLQRTWKASPHPDLATAYAYARIGDSPRDRFERIKQLAQSAPHSPERAIALATAAIDAHDWGAARHALVSLTGERQTSRVCTLMARIEAEEFGDRGRVREWLARAVHAPRDPVWTADGVVSDRWQPVSPVTGHLDAFQWRVPVEALDKGDQTLLAQKLEELARLGVANDALAGAAGEITSQADAEHAPTMPAGTNGSGSERLVGPQKATVAPPTAAETTTGHSART
jgi:HemY protein